MKRILLLLLLLLLVAGCSQVKESLYDPVDAEDKSKVEIEVTEGMGSSELGSLLSEKKLVSNQLAFTTYLKENELDGNLQTGTFLLSPSMSMKEIVDTLTTPTGEGVIQITIPEGYEVRHIVELLKEKGLIDDEKAFYDVLEKGEFNYDFLQGVDRSHHLEGFLFPDTYEFFSNASPEEIVTKFLDNFNQRFDEGLRSRAKELGLDISQAITLSSIVEREAADPDERSLISGVFHNRLKEGMMLQSCATVQYILKERKPILSYEDMAIESDYNTYINEGLPPAPIANPGLASIKAALYPDDTPYKFFVLKEEGGTTHYFAETFEEHEENIRRSEEGYVEEESQEESGDE